MPRDLTRARARCEQDDTLTPHANSTVCLFMVAVSSQLFLTVPSEIHRLSMHHYVLYCATIHQHVIP